MLQTKFFWAVCALFLLALFVYPSNARAGIAGYPVVLVNGFQPSQLTQCPDTAQQHSDGYAYWNAFWDQHSNARLDWSSCSRVETGVAQELWPQLRSLSVSGLCQNGCIFVTHSTGDLVARYLLANQAHWLTVAGLQPIKVIAVLDFGGAGGGIPWPVLPSRSLTTMLGTWTPSRRRLSPGWVMTSMAAAISAFSMTSPPAWHGVLPRHRA